MKSEKNRQTRYLQRMYEDLSSKDQIKVLEKIIIRLSNRPDYLNISAIKEIVETLKKDGWPMSKVIAHMDMVDIEERT